MSGRWTSFRARLTLRWTIAVGVLLGLANLVIYAGAHLYLYRWLDHNVRTVRRCGITYYRKAYPSYVARKHKSDRSSLVFGFEDNRCTPKDMTRLNESDSDPRQDFHGSVVG